MKPINKIILVVFIICLIIISLNYIINKTNDFYVSKELNYECELYSQAQQISILYPNKTIIAIKDNKKYSLNFNETTLRQKCFINN